MICISSKLLVMLVCWTGGRHFENDWSGVLEFTRHLYLHFLVNPEVKPARSHEGLWLTGARDRGLGEITYPGSSVLQSRTFPHWLGSDSIPVQGTRLKVLTPQMAVDELGPVTCYQLPDNPEICFLPETQARKFSRLSSWWMWLNPGHFPKEAVLPLLVGSTQALLGAVESPSLSQPLPEAHSFFLQLTGCIGASFCALRSRNVCPVCVPGAFNATNTGSTLRGERITAVPRPKCRRVGKEGQDPGRFHTVVNI